MLTALYYPRIKVGADLFKNSLFLWDRLEYITPDAYSRAWYDDAELDEAVTSFTDPHVPSQEEKQLADEAVVELLSHPLPDWFYLRQDQIPDELRYSIYPQKFLPQTWDTLQQRGLARPLGDGYDTTAALGLTMMSILADCCAGTQKRLVTDETVSYSVLDRYLATIGGAELGRFDDKSERLVTISLKVMDFKDVKLARLVELRQKEKTASGAHLTALRHGYLQKIEEYADRLNQAKSESDVEELKRVFEQEMRKCLGSPATGVLGWLS
jgi:hypothetical protein